MRARNTTMIKQTHIKQKQILRIIKYRATLKNMHLNKNATLSETNTKLKDKL